MKKSTSFYVSERTKKQIEWVIQLKQWGPKSMSRVFELAMDILVDELRSQNDGILS